MWCVVSNIGHITPPLQRGLQEKCKAVVIVVEVMKGKVRPATGHEGPEALNGVGGPQGLSGRGRKITRNCETNRKVYVCMLLSRC